MIITRLGGGLGNQMFQYTIGRALALKNNDVLKLDISTYTPEYPRQYGLKHFNIDEHFATPEESRKLRLPYGFFSRVIRSFRARVLRQFYVGYHPEVMERKGDVFLEGFWKNEKYFLDIEQVIRKDFTLKNPLSAMSRAFKEKIQAERISVSLHVRRGDYVNDEKTGIYHGVCSPEYYRKAIEKIKEKCPAFILFVFSDDILWVKENMKFDIPAVYVSHKDIPDYEELVLMSLCSHNIIANSTFSWWGAWLNANPEKIIIAPYRWLAKTGDDHYKEVPDSWIKIR